MAEHLHKYFLGIKKKSHSVVDLHCGSCYQIFVNNIRHGFVLLKKTKSAEWIFFGTQNPIFEKARKWAKKREKRRKTCVFQGASFLYALRGGVDDVKDELFISLRETFFEVFL